MPGGLPKKTAHALLDIEDKDYVPIIRNPQATTADTEAVFYFPGCGSERLFSQVGLATQAMLWHAGVQTVLPLKRFEVDMNSGLLEADNIVVEMARVMLGENRLPDYVARANKGGIERVLL